MYNFSMRDSPERTNNFILENRLLYFPCIIITISTNPSVNLTRQRQYTTFLHTRMYKMYIDIIMTMTTFLAILSVYSHIWPKKTANLFLLSVDIIITIQKFPNFVNGNLWISGLLSALMLHFSSCWPCYLTHYILHTNRSGQTPYPRRQLDL